MSANTRLTHDCLTNRYQFNGILRLETGLHIGSGRSSNLTDALIIRSAEGLPYIPGSSFKGPLRSTVERIAPNIPAILTCQLSETGASECLTVTHSLQKKLQDLRENCETAQRTNQGYATIAQEEEWAWLVAKGVCNREELASPSFSQELPYRFIERYLCHTCQLFGSTVFAARLRVADLLIRGDWFEMTEIRDGVGIDRDTETAKPRIKFNLEVLPAGTEFAFRLDAENLQGPDLGLLCIGLQEFRAGNVPLGGRSSRGLGQCVLDIESIRWTDLTDSNALIAYLTTADDSRWRHALDTPAQVEQFIGDSIRKLFSGERHAQETPQ